MKPSYLDESLSIKQRVENILGQMTLEEKVHEMNVRLASGDKPSLAALANNITQKEAIDKSRLGIPLILARETSHGVNTAGVTSFPAAICTASTWDTDLVERVGAAIAAEARAQGVHQGISPILDITRDPRWGRMEEGCGEDALLTSRLGVAFVKGLQSTTLNTDCNIIATAKHLPGYGAANGGKDNDPIEICQRTLEETYFPPFKAVIQEADLQSIMICFGAVNGIPCTADKKLVTDTLAKWNFNGFAIDDCPGTAGLLGHHVAADMKEAVRLAIGAGIDQQFMNFNDLPSRDENDKEFERVLIELVKEGKISESRINDAARKILRAKFRLGLFERPYVEPDTADKVANDPAHKLLAYKTAAKGITLLKNENNLLPLKKDISSIAVIGPNADVARLGNYSGIPDKTVSPLEGIRNNFSSDTEIYYAKGCGIKAPGRFVDKFSLRFSGNIRIDFEGEYQFYASAKDGVRIWLDGKKIIDNWKRTELKECTGKIFLGRGNHSIKVEYFNYGSNRSEGAGASNAAVLRLSWSSSSIEKQIVPNHTLSHTSQLGVQQDGVGEGLLMDVFLGENFETPLPKETRTVETIDFDWGNKSPITADDSEAEADSDEIRQAAEAARKAEVAIVFVGEASSGPEQVCGEHYDRTDLGLPGQQQALVQAVYKTGTPTIVVLINGRSLAVSWIADNVPAILEAWYIGERGGDAIADILCGKVNPSGKLPVSVPRSAGQLPVYYNRRPRMGYYIDSSSDPLFPFGFGLSYTNYKYENLVVNIDKFASDDTIEVNVDVTNIGDRDGEEIVQLYIRDVISSVTTPVKQLKNFRRIILKSGQKQKVSFSLTKEQLSLLDCDLNLAFEPGEFEIMAGANSVDLLKASITIN